MTALTHLDATGAATMVDVGDKAETVREARAEGLVLMLPETLALIEADRAWFMEHGRLTVPRSKAISREIAGLCRKIRPLAEDLVDAFDVPVEMLRAPDLIGG